MIEHKLPLPQHIPDHKCSYSDHEAVHAKISITKRKNSIDLSGTCPTNYITVNGSSFSDTLQEGIEVCDQILKRLRSDKNCYFVMAILLVIPLFFLIDVYPPFGWGMPYLIAKMCFIGIIIFFMFMATIWNSIERNGILSTKLSMEMARTSMAHYEHHSSFSGDACD